MCPSMILAHGYWRFPGQCLYVGSGIVSNRAIPSRQRQQVSYTLHHRLGIGLGAPKPSRVSLFHEVGHVRHDLLLRRHRCCAQQQSLLLGNSEQIPLPCLVREA